MAFHVAISPAALATAEEIYLRLSETHPHRAADWFNDLMDAIASLEEFPLRCGLAFESFAFDTDIRQLLYGKRPHIYRVLFSVEGNDVNVHHIRHCRQHPLDLGELGRGQSE